MKNLLVWITLFFIGSTYVKTSLNSDGKAGIDSRLAYLIGNWHSTGFITDEKGFQQYIDIRQNIAADNNQLTFNTVGKNPSNGYRYTVSKAIFYNVNEKNWRVKGNINDRYKLDNKVFITDNNTITYTFLDAAKNEMRYTITKESNDSFTETEEILTKNGWDKTAWYRTKRIIREEDTATISLN